MQRFTIFSDYVCPFCYLAETALGRLREVGVALDYRAFELRPAPVAMLDLNSEYIVRGWRNSVVPLAAALGVGLTMPRVAPRSRKAHELAAFARERGRFPAIHRALFKAYFHRGLDIGRIDVLVGIAADVGLDMTETKVALDIDQYTDAVIEQERAAARMGVVAVPTIITSAGERLAGVQSYEDLLAIASDRTTE
jgi:predicted DsbA family dithiol-disulfide isomerase